MMDTAYSVSDFTVFATQCGPDDRLFPYVLMGMLQEAADRSAREDDFGTDVINKHDACWIVLRSTLKILRMPDWGETIHIRTWCSELRKFYFSREYEVVDDNNEVIVSATSLWIMASMENHRPVIPAHLGMNFVPRNTRKPLESDSPKLLFPDWERFSEGSPVAIKYADYSELDHNHHVNNARYIAWAIDAIKLSGMDPSVIHGFTVNFVKEVYEGEEVLLYTDSSDEGVFVWGYKKDGEKVFSFEFVS